MLLKLSISPYIILFNTHITLDAINWQTEYLKPAGSITATVFLKKSSRQSKYFLHYHTLHNQPTPAITLATILLLGIIPYKWSDVPRIPSHTDSLASFCYFWRVDFMSLKICYLDRGVNLGHGLRNTLDCVNVNGRSRNCHSIC